jgi:hypothetical protein
MPTHLHSFSRICGKPGEIPEGIWRIALRQARILNTVHKLMFDKGPIVLQISPEWRMEVSPKGEVELANHQCAYTFNESTVRDALTY